MMTDIRNYERSSLQDQEAKKPNNKATQGPNQLSGYRRVAISFGVLCLLQVALNITLRLYSLNKWQMRYSSLVEEKDLLMMNYTNLIEEQERLLMNFTSLTEENERLQGLKHFQSSLYFFSSEWKSWEKARENCRQRGADLVIINSKEEQEFLTVRGGEFWIGLSDRESEGVWKWVDGTLLTNGSLTFWRKGEPNDNGKDEDCVQMWKLGEWNDLSCSFERHWICEKNA